MSTKRTGFTLIELLVVVAIIALLVSILLPSLGQAKELAMTVICSSHQNGAYKGWLYYQEQYGVWMAPWDRGYAFPAGDPRYGNPDGDGNLYDQQWPYAMNVYVAAFNLPDGEDMAGAGGWWSPDGRIGVQWAKMVTSKRLQCSVMDNRPQTNEFWKDWTTLSYFVMGIYYDPRLGQMEYGLEGYPKPDLMTHTTSTGLLMCQAGLLSEAGTNAWVHYQVDDFYAIDPHGGESNVTFCDGHTDTVAHAEFYETMWQSQWERGDTSVTHDELP